MTYVSGFLLAVPSANQSSYLEVAKMAAPFFKKHGALRCVENWGVDVPPGKVTSFPMATKAADHETVVFSWIEWPSKDVADAGMKAAMEDMDAAGHSGMDMPFDGMRMMWGGFETIFEA